LQGIDAATDHGVGEYIHMVAAATIPPMALSTTRPSNRVRLRRPGMAAAMNAKRAIKSKA
jgi:hypothetical protein